MLAIKQCASCSVRPRQYGFSQVISTCLHPVVNGSLCAGASSPRSPGGSRGGAATSSGGHWGDPDGHEAGDALLAAEPPRTEGDAPAHVMIEHIPVTAYNRVILCSSMLSDHFLPRYMAALASVIAGMAPGSAAPPP